MKLILGTASLGLRPYGEGITQAPSSEELDKILDCAYEGGIRILEGAEAYDSTAIEDERFELIYKVTHPYSLHDILVTLNRDYLMGLLYHHGHETRPQMPLEDPRIQYRGASIYSFRQLTGQEEMVEVSLNLENHEFKSFTAPCKLVRSVFGRGTLLKQYSVKECLDYVKSITNVHGVVVGVNSVKEMEEIAKAWNS